MVMVTHTLITRTITITTTIIIPAVLTMALP